ncbi:hypothetical protein K523DRAFT_147544 [Schizophyllum commune Tattone D]|nr:hypothetical protein K523DRAFT_147544 [Schizophyllum commune Tattone D]
MARTFGLFDFLLPPSCERGRARTRPHLSSSNWKLLGVLASPAKAWITKVITIQCTSHAWPRPKRAHTPTGLFRCFPISGRCFSRPRTITRRNAPSFSSPYSFVFPRRPCAHKVQQRLTGARYLHPPHSGPQTSAVDPLPHGCSRGQKGEIARAWWRGMPIDDDTRPAPGAYLPTWQQHALLEAFGQVPTLARAVSRRNETGRGTEVPRGRYREAGGGGKGS